MADRRLKAASSSRLSEASGALAPGPAYVPEPTPPPPERWVRLRRRLERFERTKRLLDRLARMKRWKLVLLVLAFAFTSSGLFVYFGPVALSGTPPLQNAMLFDVSGKPIGEIRPEQNRVVVPYSSIPKVVRHAFVAAEDERFFSHPGIDPLALLRAVYADFSGAHEGASTITQQYAKNEFVGSERTLWRKVREAVTAIRLDRRFSKQQILGAYLNIIYLGNGAYGVEAASRLYFGHPIAEATLQEAALLAGITASPSRYDPRHHPDAATARRNYVLDRMLKLKLIAQADADAARNTPLVLAKPLKQASPAPGFVDWVRKLLLEQVGEDRLYRGGLQVKTTLDLDVQKAAEDAVAEELGEKGDPDAAVVTIDVGTGGVRAMVGGRDKKIGDLNLATQGLRQPGSAFKPIVLATALSKGKTLDDTYWAPASITIGDHYRVSNYDHSGYGDLTLKSATAYSVNTVYAQLVRDIGADSVVEYAKRLGIGSDLRADASLALGTSEVTPLDLATAYAAIARDGTYLATTGLSKVADGDGVDLTLRHSNRSAIKPSVADDVIEALKAVVSYGTATRAQMSDYEVFGKTGTTEDHADAWFCGGAGGAVTCVWVGYPRGRVPMNDVHGIKVTGNSFPLRIWKRVMTVLLNKYHPPADQQAPSGPAPRRSHSSAPSAGPSQEPSEEPAPEPTRTRGPIVIPTILHT